MHDFIYKWLNLFGLWYDSFKKKFNINTEILIIHIIALIGLFILCNSYNWFIWLNQLWGYTI